MHKTSEWRLNYPCCSDHHYLNWAWKWLRDIISERNKSVQEERDLPTTLRDRLWVWVPFNLASLECITVGDENALFMSDVNKERSHVIDEGLARSSKMMMEEDWVHHKKWCSRSTSPIACWTYKNAFKRMTSTCSIHGTLDLLTVTGSPFYF